MRLHQAINNRERCGQGDKNSSKILVDKFGSGFGNIVMVFARDYHNIAVKSDHREELRALRALRALTLPFSET